MSLLRDKLIARGVSDPVAQVRVLAKHCLDHPGVGAQMPPDDSVAQQRLREIGRMAIRESPNQWDGVISKFFGAIRNDPDLLWTFMAPFRQQAAQRYLTEISDEMRGPRPLRDTRPARSATPPAPAVMIDVAQRSLLETFKIGSVPLGDATPREALRWSRARAIGVQFINRLVANLPIDRPIREFVSPEFAQATLEQVQREDEAEHVDRVY